jgi:hypothetical protein
MVHIKIGVPCDTFKGFREIPLPAPNSLWGARTRSEWQSEYELYKTMPRMGLELFGDLIDACRQSSIGSNRLIVLASCLTWAQLWSKRSMVGCFVRLDCTICNNL